MVQMKEVVQKPERAILVTVNLRDERAIQHLHAAGIAPESGWTINDEKAEFDALVRSTGADVVHMVDAPRTAIDPALFIGKGKAAGIAEWVREHGADVVIFNKDLSNRQQQNLEEALGIKTIDRTQLILDIFARHATTRVGKLQVELAQLEYLLPRLTGKGIMLMRQEGGIGVRGPGETKLEVDRRRITDRITHIKNEIKQVRVHREMLRKKRRREEIPYVALVGYTSAGKTSLLNALTGAGKATNATYFTTLDTVTRILQVGALDRVLIADTVGFVHDLPEKLVEAFMATLEELRDADLLLHVVDVANPHYNKMQHAVTQLLDRLDLKDKPLLYVYNKVDLLDSEQLATRSAQHTRNSVFVSASTGEGLEDLLAEIGDRLSTARVVEVTIPYGNTAALNYLYKHARVHDTRSTEDGSLIFEVTMTPEALGALGKLNKSVNAS